MSVQATFFSVSLQNALDTYSGSFESLTKKIEEMDIAEGSAERACADPFLSTKSEDEKKQLLEQNLATYHTFVRTQAFANELIANMQSTNKRCHVEPIPGTVYETIGNLKYDAKAIRESEQALTVVNKHLVSLIESFSSGLVFHLNKQVPEVASAIDSLASALFPKQASSTFLIRKTPTLSWHYTEWLKTVTDEQKNWNPEIKTHMADSAIFDEASEGSLKELDDALKVLGLNFVEPKTNRGYGVKPTLSAPAFKAPAALPEASDKQTLYDSKAEGKMEDKIRSNSYPAKASEKDSSTKIELPSRKLAAAIQASKAALD